MLHGDLVAPGDVVAREAEGGGDAVALLGTGRPAAQHDRHDSLLIQVHTLGQLPGVDPILDAELLNGPDGLGHDDVPPLWSCRGITGPFPGCAYQPDCSN